MIDWPMITFIQTYDYKRQLIVTKVTDTHFHGVPEFVGKQKEGSCLFKPLLPQQNKGILLSLVLPLIFSKVVVEESSLLRISNTPG